MSDVSPLVHPAAASIAAAMRSRLHHREPPPPPRADKALLLWSGAILLAAVLGTALAYWGIRIAPEPPGQTFIARVGSVVLSVPRALSGPLPDDGQQVVGMVRLRLSWPELGPVSLSARQIVHVTVTPADRINDPQTQLAMMARFLTPIAWSNAGGLVARTFATGSPFESDELYVSQPDGREFAARCPMPVNAAANEELCRTTLRHRGVDIALRFPREAIPEWQALTSGIRLQIDTMLR
jgi:hypothetical protein